MNARPSRYVTCDAVPSLVAALWPDEEPVEGWCEVGVREGWRRTMVSGDDVTWIDVATLPYDAREAVRRGLDEDFRNTSAKRRREQEEADRWDAACAAAEDREWDEYLAACDIRDRLV